MIRIEIECKGVESKNQNKKKAKTKQINMAVQYALVHTWTKNKWLIQLITNLLTRWAKSHQKAIKKGTCNENGRLVQHIERARECSYAHTYARAR